MSKILVLGYPPSILAAGGKIEAANYRTWQLVYPLLRDGHTVNLCSPLRPAGFIPGPVPAEWARQLCFTTIDFFKAGWRSRLRGSCHEFRPDCVLAVNFDMCLFATSLTTPEPAWMDIYGDPLTILQAALSRAQNNRGLPTSINFMHEVLRSGDKYSVCGLPQKNMLVGELAMAGRLNHRTFGYEFAEVIMPGALPPPAQPSSRSSGNPLSSMGIKPGDFVVLWCGGYNTWTDVETLFSGLEKAMRQNEHIHFVSLGASTYSQPADMYSRLLELTSGSIFKSRYHMLGWRPWCEIADYYQVCDVGLNIDALHYETIYGTRTRLLEMMANNLPVITTLGSEISYYLSSQQACLGFPVGNPEALANAVIRLAADPALVEGMRIKAAELCIGELSYESTTAPLRAWARAPFHSPDKCEGNESTLRSIEYKGRSIVRGALWKLAGLCK